MIVLALKRFGILLVLLLVALAVVHSAQTLIDNIHAGTPAATIAEPPQSVEIPAALINLMY